MADKVKCNHCGHEWTPRGFTRPKVCHACNSKFWDIPRGMPKILVKRCSRCKQTKPRSEFGARRANDDGLQGVCRECRRISCSDSKHRLGYCAPMNESKDCNQYLGICVAERVINNCGMFKTIVKMPNNNPGFDFICNREFKIDVKSACRTFVVRNEHELNPWWTFHIDHNTIADWFVIIAFDDREHLIPLHAWVIPGDKINHLICLTITESERSLEKWRPYERLLDQIDSCCDELRSN